MKKNSTILRTLTCCGAVVGVALLAWAIFVPMLKRSEARELVEEARQRLSPTIEGMTDIDEVDCSGAEALLQRALELAPSNGTALREVQLARGCAALLRRDLVLAESSLRSAARRLPSDPRPQRWLGSLALTQGDAATAQMYFERSLQIDPAHRGSQIGLSDALAELGQLDEALETIDAVDSAPLAIVELRRGMLLEELERVDDARLAYGRALELSPEMAEVRNNLAALEREAGNLSLAWEHQTAALRRSPDDSLMLLNAGLLAIARGYDEEALLLFRRASELERNSADPSRALADHLLVMGNSTEALEVLGTALEEFPRDAPLRNSLGNALATVGRIEEARRAYRDAIDIDGDLAEPHNGLGALMLAAGDLAGAQEALDRAARLDPSNTQIRRNLIELYRRRGERELAEREQRIAQALRSGLSNK